MKCRQRRQSKYYEGDSDTCDTCKRITKTPNARTSVHNVFEEQPLNADPTVADLTMLIRGLVNDIVNDLEQQLAEKG